METKSTLLLGRSDVREFLGMTECIDAVETVFRLQGEGKIPPSGILGVRRRAVVFT
jgi:ornithine cyclodeaminase/alanine dehydrogenase-like protein (mu-crystallin family)